MLQLKDPAIKLFGKTIKIMPNQLNSGGSLDKVTEGSCCCDRYLLACSPRPSMEGESKKGTVREKVELPERELNANTPKDGTSSRATEELKDSTTSSNHVENPPIASATVPSSAKANNNVLEDSESSISHKNSVKKPDKILPCPRCNSMDTKFCYYNNYNVNQPRYFCRKCQRYWTSGGTMRNVPVGSGRRKSKSSCATYYRHIMLSEMPKGGAQFSAANGVCGSLPETNGSVLSFGPESSFNRPMAFALSKEERAQNHDKNGFNDSKRRKELRYRAKESGDDQSTGSSVTNSSLLEQTGKISSQELVAGKEFPTLAQCFPGPVWPGPWNLTQGNPIRPFLASHTSGYPVTFYQATPLWNCPLSSFSNNYPSEVGKRSLDGKINNKAEEPLKGANESARNSSTLGIDDSKATLNSSGRTTLGMKTGSKSITRTGIFDAFQSNGDIHNHIAMMSPFSVIQANPAALCRSMNFQERM